MDNKLREEWVKWTDYKPLTNTESKFLDYIFSNEELMNHIKKTGNLKPIFADVVNFLKNKKQ